MKLKCSKCGYSKCQRAIHEHHKDGNHLNNEPSNRIYLCANCHAEAHERLGDCNGEPKRIGYKHLGMKPPTQEEINKFVSMAKIWKSSLGEHAT